MWNWFKGKSQENSPEPKKNNLPQTDTNDQTNQLHAERLSQALDLVLELVFLNNAKASLLYANAAGYDGQVIDYNNVTDFTEFLEKPFEEFPKSKIASSQRWIKSEITKLLNSAELRKKARNSEERESINFLNSTVKQIGIEKVESLIGRDTGAAALEKVIILKALDISDIHHLLNEKGATLRPLFQAALTKGKNKYGEQSYSEFFSELSDFFEYFFPEGSLRFYFSVKPFGEIGNYILQWMNSNTGITRIPTDGIDFEFWCASQLEIQGWNCRVTQSSGDQGVDIEATRDNFRVVIQCKRYSQPIGNKAVQEIFTGRQHRAADAAAIIGTGGFTRSAIELANSTEVKLVDASQINDFSEIFDFKSLSNAENTEDEELLVVLNSGVETYLGRAFSVVSARHFQRGSTFTDDVEMIDEMLELSQKVESSIDPIKGTGSLLVKPQELVKLLLFSESLLVSMVELSEENADYESVDNEGEKTIFNHMSPVENYGQIKLKEIAAPIHYYELFEPHEVDELRSFIKNLYRKLPETHRMALETSAPYRPFTQPGSA